MLSRAQIVAQSKNAIEQWHEQWRKHAQIHAKFPQKSWEPFRHYGFGKAIVCVANGASLAHDIETIKAHPETDVLVCDKTLGHMLDNGIKPTFCLLADANVSYEKYCEPYKDQLGETVLFANICGNPKWTHEKWKDIYFFANKDVLGSEKEFIEISGCPNSVPAGSNVSNAMVILLTQCIDRDRQNFFGYEKILLTGFDYSWEPFGDYYYKDHTGNGKHHYMRHQYCQDYKGEMVYTSHNLAFSGQWLDGYVKSYGLPVFQCSQSTILPLGKVQRLEDHIGYKFSTKDRIRILQLDQERNLLNSRMQAVGTEMQKIYHKHRMHFISTC